MILRRLTPLATGLGLLIGFELLFARPSWYHLTALMLVGLVILGHLIVHPRPRRELLLLLTAPLLLVAGAWLILLFTAAAQWPVRQALAFAVAGLVWYELEQVFAFTYRTASYQAFALENIVSYLNLASVFLIVSGLFGLRFFIGYPLWLVLSVSTIVLFLTSYHTLAMAKIDRATRRSFSVLLAVLGGELLVSLSLLPSNHWVNGLIVATYYYVAVNLTHFHLRGALDRDHLRRYVLLGLLVVSLTVLTAPWR